MNEVLIGLGVIAAGIGLIIGIIALLGTIFKKIFKKHTTQNIYIDGIMIIIVILVLIIVTVILQIIGEGILKLEILNKYGTN
jgi:hypothetical protein